jgi:hypothetical protein
MWNRALSGWAQENKQQQKQMRGFFAALRMTTKFRMPTIAQNDNNLDGDFLVAGFDVGDVAVAHVDDAVGYLGGLGVVGDHQDGLV